MSSTPQFTLNYLNKLVSQKSSWTITLDMPIDPMMKYAGFTTYNDLVAAYPNYLDDITDEGAWNYYLTNLQETVYGGGQVGDEMLAKSLFYRGYDFSGDEPVPLETVNLTSFNVNLPALTDGRFMFYGTPITSFTSEMPNLEIGYSMFAYCPNLTEWSVPLEKLQFGDYMFAGSAINSQFPSLPALKSGSYMFDSSAMTSWDTNLPVLEQGEGMFGGSSLTYFSGNLGNLTYAEGMFGNTPLQSFETEDLSLLEDAAGMFCGTSLSSFDIALLPSLTSAWGMFERCSHLRWFSSLLPSLIQASYMFDVSYAEINDENGLTRFVGFSPLLEEAENMFARTKKSFTC